MEDYVRRLEDMAERFVEPFLDIDDIPMIRTSGSYGDPFGHITPSSDIDLGFYVTNNGYIDNPESISVPYELEKVMDSDGAVCRTEFEEETIHLWFTQFFPSRSYMENRLRKLENLDDLITFDSDGVLNRGVHNFEDYIKMMNSKCFRDDWGISERLERLTRSYFSDKRPELAVFYVEMGTRTMAKIDDFSKYLDHGVEIDLSEYNGSVVKSMIDLLTYIRCCSKNVPRDMGSIEKRRNIELWKVVDIDRNLVNSSFSVTEDISDSLSVLKELTKKIYFEAKAEMPEITTYRVERNMRKVLGIEVN